MLQSFTARSFYRLSLPFSWRQSAVTSGSNLKSLAKRYQATKRSGSHKTQMAGNGTLIDNVCKGATAQKKSNCVKSKRVTRYIVQTALGKMTFFLAANNSIAET